MSVLQTFLYFKKYFSSKWKAKYSKVFVDLKSHSISFCSWSYGCWKPFTDIDMIFVSFILATTELQQWNRPDLLSSEKETGHSQACYSAVSSCGIDKNQVPCFKFQLLTAPQFLLSLGSSVGPTCGPLYKETTPPSHFLASVLRLKLLFPLV